MPENEQPPIGEPIYDPPPIPDTERTDHLVPVQITWPDSEQWPQGENVVITPQTAGSAGAAHTEEG